MKIHWDCGELTITPESESEKRELIDTFGGFNPSITTMDAKGVRVAILQAASSHEVELGGDGRLVIQVTKVASSDE